MKTDFKATMCKCSRPKVALVLMALFCLCSCNDIKLAEQLDGTWQTSYENYNEGLVENITETVTFNYDEDSWEDDGTFVKMLSGRIDDIDFDEDFTCDCKYLARVTGRWSVDQGNLSLIYDISTFELKFNRDDVTINTSIYLSSTDRRGLQEAIVEDLRSHLQGELRNQFIESNEDGWYYENLKVSGNKMSYNTSDYGRIEFQKINGD